MSARYKHGQKWISNAKRCAVYARDSFRCAYCLARPHWLELDQRWSSLLIDHVEPFGGNLEDNLVTCCEHCNRDKSDRTLSEWLRAREAYGDELELLKSIEQRVALLTFLPLDRALGVRLEGLRGRGYGSFSALALLFDSLTGVVLDGAEGGVRHVA